MSAKLSKKLNFDMKYRCDFLFSGTFDLIIRSQTESPPPNLNALNGVTAKATFPEGGVPRLRDTGYVRTEPLKTDP